MKVAIKFTDAEKTIISQLEFFDARGRSKFVDKCVPDLPLEKIMALCCTAFDISESELLGKINHADSQNKIRKLTFYAGLWVFSNKDSDDFKKFTNYKGSLFWYSLQEVLHLFKRSDKNAGAIMQYFASLNKACPNRLKRLTEVDLSMVSGVSDWNGVKLTAYQISKMPLHDLPWFYNDNKWYNMLCFNPAREKDCKYISFDRTSDHLIFYALQNQGFRFCRTSEWDKYKNLHPICDKCLHSNNCEAKSCRMFGGFLNAEFKCFENLPTDRLKVDIKLLFPMKHYQLQ